MTTTKKIEKLEKEIKKAKDLKKKNNLNKKLFDLLVEVEIERTNKNGKDKNRR